MIEIERINETMSVQDVFVRSHLMTSVSDVEDKNFEPIAFGSGFFVKYNNRLLFVTADHTLHLDDYEPGKGRTSQEYQISIFNNVDGKDLSTILTPVGGFHYMEKYDVKNLDADYKGEPIDITACVMQEYNLQKPFMTQKFKKENGETFQLPVIVLGTESFENPQSGKKCIVWGQVHTRLKGIQLQFDNVIYEMDYVSTNADFHLFHADDIVTYANWGGLSGSPIIDEEGKCVGVLTTILEGTNSVWGISTKRLKMLLDMVDKQESV